MAAPVAAKVILPLDSGNTGKNIRTQTRVVGADTVHEYFFIESTVRERIGRFGGTPSAASTVSATAHTFGTGGFWWFINPTGTTSNVAIYELETQTQLGSALVAVTSPRLCYSTFTYTGTPSGAAVTCGKFDSNSAAPTASFRTAITGMTLTKVADIHAFLPVASATAVGYAPPSIEEMILDREEQQIILRAGQGLCLWQMDAGTAADTRRIATTIIWEEFN